MGAIYLIRHGQASFGKPDYDKLSKTGWQQSAQLGLALRERGLQVDAVYSGGMKRHRQTAERCLESMGLDQVPKIVTGFNEFDHEQIIRRAEPRYSNKLVMLADMARTLKMRQAFEDFFAQAISRWVEGEHQADYAESWPHFCERCVGALEQVVDELGPSKTALVFTSGGPIMAIARHLLNLGAAESFRLSLGLVNCGITKVVYGAGSRILSSLNEHSRFEGVNADLLTYR